MLSVVDITKERLPFGKVDSIYCDPPWNQTVLDRFYKIAGAGISPQFDFFVEKLVEVCLRHCQGGTWMIEIGKENLGVLIDKFSRKSERTAHVYVTKYSSGYGYLVVFPPRNRVMPARFPVIGGVKLVRTALLAFGNGSVLDPCCGCGTTFLAAKKLKREFFGNDINRNKIEKLANRYALEIVTT